MRAWLAVATGSPARKRALAAALVAGALLVLAAHRDTLLSGPMKAAWVDILLALAMPCCVVTYADAEAARPSRQERGETPLRK